MAAYPHRKNCDGSFDSICPECFRTIARVWDERELEAAEAAHRCEVGRMEELRQDRAFRDRVDVAGNGLFLVPDAA